MSWRVAAAIAGLILGGGAVAGGIAVATGSSFTAAGSTPDGIAAASATATTTTQRVPTTASALPQSPPAKPTSSTPTSPTSPTPPTPPTLPTLPTPIVTFPADIGVLAPTPVAAPLRVVIPALEIDGPVIPAGVNAASELDVPRDARTLVWYRHGPSPGEPGSAVIAGHLNWRGVTGLFARLDETPVGASITIVYDDGSEKAFTVSAVELQPKPAVSVNGVFARDGQPLLRLVTCGGDFEDEIRSYRSNVVVTAVPA